METAEVWLLVKFDWMRLEMRQLVSRGCVVVSIYEYNQTCCPWRLRWAGHVTRMEEGKSAFKILTGKPTGKRPLGRPRRRWAGHVARMEEGRSAFKILTGKPTGKRPLGRPRRRWAGHVTRM